MGRVINPHSLQRERRRILQALRKALDLYSETADDAERRDLAAFMVLALEAVAASVERTVAPWEQRDYWVKADRFRREWAWAGRLAPAFRKAVLEEEWEAVGVLAAELDERLQDVTVSARSRLGEPWTGAWEQLVDGG